MRVQGKDIQKNIIQQFQFFLQECKVNDEQSIYLSQIEVRDTI